MSDRTLQPSLVGQTLDQAIEEARAIVTGAIQDHKYVAVVELFSGGDDSSVMLHLCKEFVDFALHINTGIGIEETRVFARQTAADWDIRLVEEFTSPDWYRNNVLKHGFPGPVGHRVMYHNLKRERLRDVRRRLCRRGERLLLLSGERAHESPRRMGYGGSTTNINRDGIWVNPIHYFTNWHMHGYRQRFELPRNPVSEKIHKSGECLCGAFAHRYELWEMEIFFPEAAAYIKTLEKEAALAGHGKRSQWAWGSESRRPSDAPGPLCSSCHQLPLEETA